MHIVAAGDHFVLPHMLTDALAHALARRLGPAAPPFTSTHLEFDWPDTPLQEATAAIEVREYVGDPQAIAQVARDAEVLMVHTAPVTRALLEACPQLRIVGVTRGGCINVNVEAATERGIPVVHAPGRNAQAAIEYTVGMLLAAARGIAPAHVVLREGVWEGNRTRYDTAGRELRGQTVGLVGFGAIAQGLAPYLHALGMCILAYDPYAPTARFDELGATQVDFATLLAESDFVSIHARVTPETQHLINAAALAQMKPGAYLINTARGPLVDYDALYAALVAGQIAGAALDCFATEPPDPSAPLLKLPNVTVTPHLAGNTREAAERGAEMVAEDIARFLSGAPLLRCLNARALGLVQ
jgi:D-3-phosphoglycerate dehydrogenase